MAQLAGLSASPVLLMSAEMRDASYSWLSGGTGGAGDADGGGDGDADSGGDGDADGGGDGDTDCGGDGLDGTLYTFSSVMRSSRLSPTCFNVMYSPPPLSDQPELASPHHST